MEQNRLTKKQLQQATDAKPYIVTYLTSIGRLKLAHISTGKGDPNIYHSDSIQIIKDHLSRSEI